MSETIFDNLEDSIFEFIFYDEIKFIRLKKPKINEDEDYENLYGLPSQKGMIIKTTFVVDENSGRKFPNKTYYDYDPSTIGPNLEKSDKRAITTILKAHLLNYIKTNQSLNNYFELSEKSVSKKNNSVKYELKCSDYVTFSIQIKPDELEVDDVSAFIMNLPITQLKEGRVSSSASGGDSGDPWKVEKAKSSRAACRGCGEKIMKGSIRVGQPSYFQDHLSYKWYHLNCVKGFMDTYSLLGLDELEAEEQSEVNAKLFPSKSDSSKTPKGILSDIIVEFEDSDGLTAETDIYKHGKESNLQNDDIKKALEEMEEEGLLYRPAQGKIKLI